MTTYAFYNKIPDPIKTEPIKMTFDSPKIDFSGKYDLFSKYKCPLCGDPAVMSCNCGHYIDKHGHTFTADGKESYEKHPGIKPHPDNYLNTRYNGRESALYNIK